MDKFKIKYREFIIEQRGKYYSGYNGTIRFSTLTIDELKFVIDKYRDEDVK